MAAVRHFGFLKVGNFNCRRSCMANLRHRAKFRADLSNHCGEWQFLVFFKMAAVRHIGFVLRDFRPP